MAGSTTVICALGFLGQFGQMWPFSPHPKHLPSVWYWSLSDSERRVPIRADLALISGVGCREAVLDRGVGDADSKVRVADLVFGLRLLRS